MREIVYLGVLTDRCEGRKLDNIFNRKRKKYSICLSKMLNSYKIHFIESINYIGC